MKYGVYCIRDVHIGYYTPTFQENDIVAMRGFFQALDSPDVAHSVLAYKPQDFSLFRVATFDSLTGGFEPCDPHELIADGASYRRRGDLDV